MKEEMKKILQMVEQNKITVQEAEQLIEALSSGEETAALPSQPSAAGIQGKFLRVRVTEEGEQKVQVNVPLSIVEIGLKIGMQIGPQFAPEMESLKGIDFGELMEAIRQGASGKLVEVKDEGSLVEVYVD
jgi:hypothetical protein